MNIVIVDHVYLESEHIKKLQSLGSLQIYKDPPRNTVELKERIKDAEVVIVGWTQIDQEALESASKLEMVSIWATTCHYIDLKAAAEKGITVTHVPGYATEAVAEHTFALLLATIRKLPLADQHVRKGEFDWRPFGGRELAGKTMGVIGTGAIGCRVAEIARAFKMKVLGYDKYQNAKAEEIGFAYVDLSTLLKESDVVSLHVTLTPETRKMVGRKEIATMKNGAVLVNTSQGKVVDEEALTEALRTGKIAYAGLDVFDEEPPPKDNPLFKLDNAVFSPHIGFNTLEAAKRCTDICVDNIVKFLQGQPQNTCKPSA
ncbi:MAG: 2-hydroxyacid dehydrogenase [Candidatus Bathyarchaeota archaeon]|nr:2-hydroxyacid dehydrogenase [Candidatus Bathyarchaeota archaeon]